MRAISVEKLTTKPEAPNNKEHSAEKIIYRGIRGSNHILLTMDVDKPTSSLSSVYKKEVPTSFLNIAKKTIV